MAHDHNHHGQRVAPRRIAFLTTGLIATALLAAGCGTSSASHPAASPNVAAQSLAFSKCMRAHGVPDFPDPGDSLSGPYNSIAGIAIPPTIDLQSPAFQHAQGSCRSLLAAVFSPQGKPSITPSMKTTLIDHAQCMRAHGVPSYPDPEFPATGGIAIFDAPGVSTGSPAYEHAASVCGTR